MTRWLLSRAGRNPFGDGAGMLHDWMFDAATDEDRAILQEMLGGVGAIVMGRKGIDKNEGNGGWGDSGPSATLTFRAARTIPRTPSAATFAESADRSWSSGVIIRTGA